MAKTFDAKRAPGGATERPGFGSHSARDLSAGTRMAYMADLLLELQEMATAEGHATLSGLLALAHMEALSKSR